MQEFSLLMCTADQAAKLVLELSFDKSFLSWYRKDDKWEPTILNCDKPDAILPGWTKHELEVFIGADIPKPDFWPNNHKGDNKLVYPVTYPNKAVEYPNGAHAAAEVLLYCLKNGIVNASEAVSRYKTVFKV